MKKVDYTGKVYIGLVVGLIIVVQFADSFCTEIFSKMQSFLIKDFIIKDFQPDMNEAVSKLGYMMLPFYIVPAFSPFARIFVDKYGKKKVLLVNLIFLCIGCSVCGMACNIWIYLLGNAMITFATSIDIQNMYIAQNLPEKRRATVRGILCGITALSTMTIPVCRGYFVNTTWGWKGIYCVAVIFVLIAFFAGMAIKETKASLVQKKTQQKKIEKQDNVLIKKYFIILFFVGIATSGVTLYNEILLDNNGYGIDEVNRVLFIQPAALFIVNIVIGLLADKYKRKNMVCVSLSMAIIFLSAYVIGVNYGFVPEILGIFWGNMIGCYFSAVNIIFLVLMEEAKNNNIGKISALSAYINGAGNAIGIIICTVLVKVAGMEMVKLTTAIPVLIVSIVLLLKMNKINLKEI